MQYCIYLRKSRADIESELKGEGETLSRHENILINLAKKQNLNVIKIYKEIVSGETIASRPVMQNLLTEVGKCVWDGVLVMEVERLARGDTIDQGIVAQTFKFSNTKIITPLKTYNPNDEYDEEYFEFGLFMSRREYKTINRRLQNGRISSINEGKYISATPPYGYKKKKLDSDKGFILEIDSEQSEVVKLIYDLYINGHLQEDGTYKRLSIQLITNKLNKMKIKPMKSDFWSFSSVHDILSNPTYCGMLKWQWRPQIKKVIDGEVVTKRVYNKKENRLIVKGMHEPIINEQDWNLAQHYLSENSNSPVNKNYQMQNPLSGIVICGKCGKCMIRRKLVNGKESLLCVTTGCNNVSSYLTNVENKILDALSVWLDEYKLKWEFNEEKYDNGQIKLKISSLNKLKKEYDTFKKQLDNTYDLLEQEIYTKEKFIERSELLINKIKTIEKDILSLENEIKSENLKQNNKQNIIPKIEKIIDIYYSLPNPCAKNELLKEILEKVVYIKEKKRNKKTLDDTFTITIYPKIPKHQNTEFTEV